jgi:hypothetical protein
LPWSFVARAEAAQKQDVEKLGASAAYEANWTTRTGELDFQNQVRDHAAEESDRPHKLLQQRLISLNEIGAFESPVLAGVHRAAQLLKAGMTYQAMKVRMARTMMTIAAYLIAATPVRPDDSGSCRPFRSSSRCCRSRVIAGLGV